MSSMMTIEFSRINFFFLSFLLYLFKMMNVNWAYCGNYFTIYINQNIMLSILNLHNDVC